MRILLHIVTYILFFSALMQANVAAKSFDAQDFQARLSLKATISAKQAAGELDMVGEILGKMHPSAIVNTSPEAIREMISQIKASLPARVNVAQMYLHYARLLGTLCDGHTQVSYLKNGTPYADRSKPNLFNERFIQVQNDLYSLGNASEKLRYKKLENLEGIASKDIIALIREYQSVDGCWDNYDLNMAGLPVGELMSVMFGSKKGYAAQFASAGSSNVIKTNLRAGVVASSENKLQKSRKITSGNLRKAGFKLVHQNKLMKLAFNGGKNVAYLQVADFEFEHKAFVAMTDKLMRVMGKLNAKKLILDLRYNGGGMVVNAQYLLSHLSSTSDKLFESYILRSGEIAHKKYFHWDVSDKNRVERLLSWVKGQKPMGQLYWIDDNGRQYDNSSFKGAITVLINQGTASASVLLARELQKERGAILMGQTAASSAEYGCLSSFGYYVLPHTKLRVDIPNMCYTRNSWVKSRSKALTPDIAVPVTSKTLTSYPSHILSVALNRS